ncbi:MAG TPA: hypothetical protein VK939_11550 [Longimicrobiales bacterium]|nr:hypothetical protein [Longimicrobiales bacterium]
MTRHAMTRHTRFVTLRGGAAALFAVLVGASAGAAQDNRPSGWKWVSDMPAADTSWSFNRMPPGWHITTGPGVLAWDDRHAFDGRYHVEAEMILFPDPGPEGFGLFVAGRELETAGSEYVAFLIRADGAAGVFRVQGGRSEPLAEWRPAAGVRRHEGTGTVSNTLRVEVEGTEAVFRVNGEEAVRVPTASLEGGGRTGFRIGAQINVHITTLDVMQRLAPPRGS